MHVNRTIRVFSLVLLLCGPLAGAADAHGVGYRLSGRTPVSLEFFYSTGETMAYTAAKVYSPTDDRIEFQSGRTDAAGCFAFTPDSDGIWRVVVQDEEGHRVEAKIPVAPVSSDSSLRKSIPTASQGSLPNGASLAIRACLGVSLLFNIAAFVLLRRRNRR